MDKFFSSLGIATTVYLTYRLLNHIYTFLWPSALSHYLSTSSPTYALITGSSDGIGKALAFELCARGFNVIIHGRNPDKLSRVKQELKATHSARDVHILLCDVVTFTPESLEKLLTTSGIAQLPIAILINNVGGTSGIVSQPFQRFSLVSPAEIDNLISVNQRFTTHLIRLLLPNFTSSPATPKLIMNISSHAHIGMPYIAVYSATKAYVSALSHALSSELTADGHANVAVLNIVVGSVQSNQNHSPPSLFVPSSEVMAKATLARVGCGSQSVTGYWPHALQSAPMALMPQWLVDRAIVGILKPHADSGTKEF